MSSLRDALPRMLLGSLSGRPATRRLMILTFHRVLQSEDPLLPGEPGRATFAVILEWVSRYLNVLKLPDAVAKLQAGELPPQAACITFDDGYRNNHDVALPLLERAGVPATFFIATHVGTRGGMWNDLVIEAARHAERQMDLREFGLDQYPVANAADRQRLLELVLPMLKYRPVNERADIAGQIYRRYCGEILPDLMMDDEMLRRLAAAGHDVGAHTMHHPILSKLEPSAARAEIVGSRDYLAEVLGARPTSFAYPNGQPGVDFGPEHAGFVREAGFTCAVSTSWGCATTLSDPLALPRFTPWERTRRGFYSRLVKTYLQSHFEGRQ